MRDDRVTRYDTIRYDTISKFIICASDLIRLRRAVVIANRVNFLFDLGTGSQIHASHP
jgi:hypothetical protein